MSLCVYVNACEGTLRGQKTALDPPGTGVTGSYESHNMVARNQTSP